MPSRVQGEEIKLSRVSSSLCLDRPNIIGVFHCQKRKQLEHLIKESTQLFGIDIIELRIDLLESLPCLQTIVNSPKPFIVTVRHPKEGGNKSLTVEKRLKLLNASVPLASLVDLELQFWKELSPILQVARKLCVRIIASFHHFSETPPITELLEKANQAKQCGADVFKVATYLNSPSDLACLLQLLDRTASLLPVAAMGIGPLGRASRLVLARCGSILNYGWLIRPMVSGQWEASKLAKRLKEIA